MSILPGWIKTKKYRKINGNYQLQSEDTSSETLYFNDGTTAQTNLGAIKGITDSLTATSSNVALSAKAGNSLQNQVNELNTGLANAIKIPAGAQVEDVYLYFINKTAGNLQDSSTTTFSFECNGAVCGGICAKTNAQNYSAIITSPNLSRPIVLSRINGITTIRYLGTRDVM